MAWSKRIPTYDAANDGQDPSLSVSVARLIQGRLSNGRETGG